MANVPAPRLKTAFPQIAAVSWEHPADRAALQALRAVPGFDDVVRKIISILGGERGIRLLFQGNAVRAGVSQFPKAYSLHVEVCTTFDWPVVPELYVSQTPVFNAGAYGGCTADVLKVPAMPCSTASSAKLARSRTSMYCTAASRGPGASTTPPAAMRFTHAGKRGV